MCIEMLLERDKICSYICSTKASVTLFACGAAEEQEKPRRAAPSCGAQNHGLGVKSHTRENYLMELESHTRENHLMELGSVIFM